MPQNSLLHIVTERNWMASELKNNSLGIDVIHSYGLDMPDSKKDDLWWITQGWANKALSSGFDLTLQAPGPKWLSNIDKQFSRRNVETLQVQELSSSSSLSRSNKLFWKFAEAKIDSFPAEPRYIEDVIDFCRKNSIPDESYLQVSEILDIHKEYRFFIKNSLIQGCSWYSTYEKGNQEIYYDNTDYIPKELDTVTSYVALIAPQLPSPSGYVLDVASLRSGGFAVLEANPAWCAAWYGANIDGVLKTIEASTKYHPEWTYKPDAYLVKKYSQMRPLKLASSK